eukprot:COSAG05_NODE_150_length_16171_cov_64.740356_5_plen_79_part_00
MGWCGKGRLPRAMWTDAWRSGSALAASSITLRSSSSFISSLAWASLRATSAVSARSSNFCHVRVKVTVSSQAIRPFHV